MARSPGAASSSGTTSLSKISASGSGRRRPRGSFFCEGNCASRSSRYAVAVLNAAHAAAERGDTVRSEEHTSELKSLMRISYAVFCLTKKTNKPNHQSTHHNSSDTKTNHAHSHRV